MDQYGGVKIHYSVIVFGDEPQTMLDFSNKLTISDLKSQVRTLPIGSGGPSISKALKRAKELFEGRSVRDNANRIVVVIIDKKSVGDPNDVKKLDAAKQLEENNVLVIPVAVGNQANKNELEKITPYKDNVINRPRLPDPKDLAKDIMDRAIDGKA